MSFFEIQNLSKTFKTKHGDVNAVQDVSFSVEQGECLAVVGESGSGKSTIANMILGILAPTSGAISMKGSKLPQKRSKEHRRAIQFVQQNPLSALNPKRTIGASVRLGLDTYHMGEPQERWSQVEKALSDVGLDAELRSRSPSGLSGGQRQRVSIARALACEPELLVLDEPTSALDVLVQARVLQLLNALRIEKNLTYIFITHDLAVVRNVADRVAVFKAGQLVELDTTENIFTNPGTQYTRELINAVPVIDEDEIMLKNKLVANL
ncbi:MAG: ABC transporter ATP-binding protein [Lentilitoribacter sp.]